MSTGTSSAGTDLPHRLADVWIGLLDFDRAALRLDLGWGPLELHIAGRGVFFCWVTLSVLALAGVAVALSGKAELRRRWLTWAMILPVVGIPIWIGRGPTAVLAAVIGVLAVAEFSRLAGLRPADRSVLLGLAVAYPLTAWLAPHWLALAPLAALVCALPPLLDGDTTDGIRRAAFTAFGSLWICWSLAHLVVLWEDAFLVCFAAAASDVAAWCGGRGLRRFGWARRPLSPLSPSKTLGGLAGAVIGAALVLAVLGTISVALVVGVALGGVVGDLLESMIKRTAGVKDAGSWLPGFGGLLDRVDSLLIVLPLVAVVIS